MELLKIPVKVPVRGVRISIKASESPCGLAEYVKRYPSLTLNEQACPRQDVFLNYPGTLPVWGVKNVAEPLPEASVGCVSPESFFARHRWEATYHMQCIICLGSVRAKPQQALPDFLNRCLTSSALVDSSPADHVEQHRSCQSTGICL